jgi:hypothetical protein
VAPDVPRFHITFPSAFQIAKWLKGRNRTPAAKSAKHPRSLNSANHQRAAGPSCGVALCRPDTLVESRLNPAIDLRFLPVLGNVGYGDHKIVAVEIVIDRAGMGRMPGR